MFSRFPYSVRRDVTSFSGRFLAYLDMLFVDHGIFRVIYNNRFMLPGGLFRCSNPSPGQIRRYQKKYGIKTIINLRGEDTTLRYALEEQACEDLGVRLVNFKGIWSRSAPNPVAIKEMREIFNRIEYPALLHCKSGADRAGFASALYRLFRLGEPVSEAMRELDWRYGHIRASKTGVLDAFFDEYLAYNAKQPIAFEIWMDTVYSRDTLAARYEGRGLANFFVDKVLHRE
jgi:protein tyrosine/serine phosphatase